MGERLLILAIESKFLRERIPSLPITTPQPERLTMMLLDSGPFLPGLGNSADVGEDYAVDHAVAVGFGQALQEFQRVT